MLEVKGPTSADAGVASCLLVNAEPVFRRLRDDLLDGKIFDGMIQRGGNELPKGSVGDLSKTVELPWRRQNGNNWTAPQRQGWGGHDRHESENENFQTQKIFSNSHLTYRP